MCIYVCVCLQRVNPEGFKKVTEVAKAGAIKWGALTPEEKKPYEEDAAQRKVRACVCVHMHVCHIVRVAAYDSSSSYSDQTTLRFPVPRPRENCMCEWRALTTPLHVHACVCVCVCVCVYRSQYEIQSEFLKMHPDPIPRRRKANAKDGKKMKKAKKAKDPNAPKRPLSAYLLFMNDFREEYMVRGANLCVCVCPYIPHLNGGGERRIADAD